MIETFAIDTHSERVLRTSARHMAAQLMTSMTDALASTCACPACSEARARYGTVIRLLEEWLGPKYDVPLTFTGQSREHWIVELARARVDPKLGNLALHLLHVASERLARCEAGRQNDAGYALLYYALTDETRARSLWLSLPTRAEVGRDAEHAMLAAVREVKQAE